MKNVLIITSVNLFTPHVNYSDSQCLFYISHSMRLHIIIYINTYSPPTVEYYGSECLACLTIGSVLFNWPTCSLAILHTRAPLPAFVRTCSNTNTQHSWFTTRPCGAHMQSKWRWWVVAQTSSGKSRFGHSQTGKSSERRRSAKVQSHNLLVIVIRTQRWTRICVDLRCRWRVVDPA